MSHYALHCKIRYGLSKECLQLQRRVCSADRVRSVPPVFRSRSCDATMLTFLVNLNSVYIRWRVLGPNFCLFLLSILAAYAPPSGFNDPKSRSVDFVNPCVQSLHSQLCFLKSYDTGSLGTVETRQTVRGV